MGRAVNLSPLGLYNWDQTVFDLMQIPSALDKPTLINNLLAETAELEVLYPNPVVFKNLVGIWSAKQLDIWNRLYTTTQYEYNPIENYDRIENWTDSGESGSEVSSSGTTESQVSAFDTSSYSPHDKEIQSSGSEASASNTDEHEGRIHGNIGVTTSQQMLESEMVLQEKWGNLYNHIADCFASELLVSVY